MSQAVIKVENISKLYRLGEVGTGTISHDLNRWLAKIRGKRIHLHYSDKQMIVLKKQKVTTSGH